MKYRKIPYYDDSGLVDVYEPVNNLFVRAFFSFPVMLQMGLLMVIMVRLLMKIL